MQPLSIENSDFNEEEKEASERSAVCKMQLPQAEGEAVS